MSDSNNIGPSIPRPSGASSQQSPSQQSPSQQSPGGVVGERYVSEVAGVAGPVSKKAGIGVIVAGGAILLAVVFLTAPKSGLKVAPEPKLTVHSEVSYVPPPPPPPEKQKPVQVASADPQISYPAPALPPEKETPEPPHRDTKLLVFTTSTGHASGGGAGVAAAPSHEGCWGRRRDRDEAAGFDGSGSCDDDYGRMGPGGYGAGYGGLGGYEPITAAERLAQRESLGSRLRPTVMTGASATVLQHQSYLLTMGTMIPCILQTAMDSSLLGLVVCVVPQDVQGKTGITLLDRGTKVVGEFKGGVRQGVERMFVTWTRAETPQGVIISLDSPGTDPLGRSGLDGEVDYHFWQRFGGAMLISVVDGAMATGVALASKEGTTTINTGSSEAVVASILQDSINFPPNIKKHQGELVSILVARDLDFRPVYRVLPIKPYVGGGWVPQNKSGADGRVYTK